MSLFLTQIELRELTGFAIKAKQIAQLRKMGIPFFINGCGKPVVTLAAIQGAPQAKLQPQPEWVPAVLSAANKIKRKPN